MRDFVTGLRLFGRGWGIVLRSPRLLVLGAVPALLTSVLMLGAWVALAVWIGDLAAWLTPFADGWGDTARLAARIVAGIAVLGGAVAVGVVAFSALTLAVGEPFYERIAEIVEDGLGGVPNAVETGWLRGLARGLREAVVLVFVSALCAVPLFLAGFIPVLGQTVVPVVGACVGAWMLVLELVGVAFERRGLGLAERRRALRGRRALVLGMGVPTYLLSIVPFAAVVVMPAAVVGATLLGRELLGRPTGVRGA
ncbi:CysZ protein [Streptoalloteichus tenebrarius]|uniref:CysZ protein n=1 Tax=Streptoalloteichus tenebrarius (strain ATCC 17920 / DSM 40477 / JCM 4838 / CBS 697.72 / NBRC 16177 / NCIMB 11028 / NRRL B-12390 / A12253. 1 / ISP 5477) TaxID=1933 RepID=A0ABT1HU24_STRSD|nr:EI24 domain-containing protein [Streptoalloteichus tenebrarius]MCP2259022.1 CysZ protein [Streptoalloteichus tenebrarius]BFE99653.1 EI24 domain-containing protein [Streptoalloteichus tenebrarius]